MKKLVLTAFLMSFGINFQAAAISCSDGCHTYYPQSSGLLVQGCIYTECREEEGKLIWSSPEGPLYDVVISFDKDGNVTGFQNNQYVTHNFNYENGKLISASTDGSTVPYSPYTNSYVYTYDGDKIVSSKTETNDKSYYDSHATRSTSSTMHLSETAEVFYDDNMQQIGRVSTYYSDSNQIANMSYMNFSSFGEVRVGFENGKPYDLTNFEDDTFAYYQYDENGKLKALIDQNSGNIIENYNYDAKGNLIATDANGQTLGTYSNALDMIGRRYFDMSPEQIAAYRASTDTSIDVAATVGGGNGVNNGIFSGERGKRIYTVQQANEVAGKKNKVMIRYK